MIGEWVTLPWYACERDVYVGMRRQVEAMREGLPNKNKYGKNSSEIEDHIQAAGAEDAVAFRLNVYWPGSINTFRQGVADVGKKIEVCWRREEWDLVVRPDHPDDRAYVLVRGAMPRYLIVGWMWGKDAKQERFWKDPNGKGYAWFVPENELRPISELKVHRVWLREELEEAHP